MERHPRTYLNRMGDLLRQIANKHSVAIITAGALTTCNISQESRLFELETDDEETMAEWHLENMENLAESLEGLHRQLLELLESIDIREKMDAKR